MEKARGKLILVTGGARSGKSTFAEKYAREASKRTIYIATAAGDDEEMRRRIEAHRQRRPQHFITVEERYYPHHVLEKEGRADTFILLDCLTLLLSNHILKEAAEVAGAAEAATPAESAETAGAAAVKDTVERLDDPAEQEKIMKKVLEYFSKLSLAMRSSPSDVLAVTNEVGMGLVPEYPLGRIFRDLAGRANQVVAAQADEVWFTVCGIARRFK